jgi:hypothetical protein
MTPLERAASAVQAEMRRQGVLYEIDPDEPDLSKLMMATGEVADLPAIVRAVLTAIREPTEGMIAAGWPEWVNDESDVDEYATTAFVWQAMIDAALEEG